MSDKRFTFEYDDGQWGVPLFYDDGKKLCFDDVVDLLNEQQATITAQKKGLDEYMDNIIALSKENEQLRQEQQRLYNYFRDYLEDEMSAENFGEMWDTVKVDERW